MPRTFARLVHGLVAAAAIASFSLVAPTASAVVLNISDNNCEKWALGDPVGVPAVQQLTCTSIAAATCTITGGSQGLINGTVTLTADCSPGPISSYLWTGGNCEGGTGISCSATSGALGPIVYGVTATNAKGPGAPANKTVSWVDQIVTPPTTCSLTSNPSSGFTSNMFVDLSPSCSDGAPVTTWTWTGPNLLGSTTTGANPKNQATLASGVNAFTVRAQIAGGQQGPLVTLSLNASTGGSTGGGSTGGGSTGGGSGTTGTPIAACAGYSTTKVMDISIPSDGSGNGPRKYVTDTGAFRGNAAAGFYANDALVIVFKAPPADSLFTIGVTHSGGSLGSSSTRTFALSTKPCDFSVPQSADALFSLEGNVLAVRMSSGMPGAQRLNLNPGQEYYLNVSNRAYGNTYCSNRCDVFVSPGNP